MLYRGRQCRQNTLHVKTEWLKQPEVTNQIGYFNRSVSMV